MTTPAPVPFPLASEQRSIAEHFGVWIEPAELHFNAAHFITYAGICENLEVAVEEADRQWGVCRRTLRDSA